MIGRPPAWWDEGDDPDYRFSLANERTSLAWIRTSLALVAASVAAAQLLPGAPLALDLVAGLGLAGAGALASVLAFWRWSATERSMRARRRLEYGPLVASLAALAVVLVVVSAAAAAVAVWA